MWSNSRTGTQRGKQISVLGGFWSLPGQCFEQPDLNLKLALLWADVELETSQNSFPVKICYYSVNKPQASDFLNCSIYITRPQLGAKLPSSCFGVSRWRFNTCMSYLHKLLSQFYHNFPGPLYTDKPHKGMCDHPRNWASVFHQLTESLKPSIMLCFSSAVIRELQLDLQDDTADIFSMKKIYF